MHESDSLTEHDYHDMRIEVDVKYYLPEILFGLQFCVWEQVGNIQRFWSLPESVEPCLPHYGRCFTWCAAKSDTDHARYHKILRRDHPREQARAFSLWSWGVRVSVGEIASYFQKFFPLHTAGTGTGILQFLWKNLSSISRYLILSLPLLKPMFCW